MSDQSIPVSELVSALSSSGLTQKAEKLLSLFAEFQSEGGTGFFQDFLCSDSEEELSTLYDLLASNGIGIRPVGYEFYAF